MKKIMMLLILGSVLILRLVWAPALPLATAAEDKIDKAAVDREIAKFPRELRDIAKNDILPKLDRAERPDARPADKREAAKVLEKMIPTEKPMRGQLSEHPMAVDHPKTEHPAAVAVDRPTSERVAPSVERAAPPVERRERVERAPIERAAPPVERRERVERAVERVESKATTQPVVHIAPAPVRQVIDLPKLKSATKKAAPAKAAPAKAAPAKK